VSTRIAALDILVGVQGLRAVENRALILL